MTNKTFLTILLAGISCTAYNAAAVSENFAISTTIDHEITLGNFRAASADANLNVTGDINLGTITVNLNNPENTYGFVWYNENGVVRQTYGPVVSATNITVGYFNADIPNPEACRGQTSSCGGLSLSPNHLGGILGAGKQNTCGFYIKYVSGNTFKVYPYGCSYEKPVDVNTVAGTHTSTISIEYNPE
ncbi:MAG: hypothetical protein IJ689_02455 [Alphaproteobacteria bacterium]|nr:hypothetical protein [Alphaproteobacteria bacterium]